MQTQTSQMSPIYEDNEVEFEPFKEVEDKRKTQNEENFEEEVIRAVSTASGQESTTNPVEVTESGQKASNRTRQIVMPKRFEDYYTGFMLLRFFLLQCMQVLRTYALLRLTLETLSETILSEQSVNTDPSASIPSTNSELSVHIVT
ncbi:hypothetical protein ACJJTC_014330 [Scirpophaga incertulas]